MTPRSPGTRRPSGYTPFRVRTRLPVPTPRPAAFRTILGLVSAGAAVTLALLGIYPRNRLRDNTSRPSSAVMAVRHGLHRLHSGHLGDYAAWLVFGCAAVIGLLWVG